MDWERSPFSFAAVGLLSNSSLWLALPGYAEKYDGCTTDPLHVGIPKHTDSAMKAVTANSRDLVDHRVAALIQSIFRRRQERDSEQRRRGTVGSQAADRNRRGSVETVVLEDYDGPGSSGVVAAGCYPDFATVHSSLNSEIESMKAWSSSA